MRRSVELDDSSLVEIFSTLADAEELARCALVCKRWRELCFAVTRLEFYFSVMGQEELRNREDIILGVLRRAKLHAPGCLKELKVSLECRKEAEALGIWLACADSVTALELDECSHFKSVRWGHSVLPMVSLMGALERLHLSGEFYSGNLATDSPLRRLRTCLLYEPRGDNAKLLEGLLMACPLLEELSVDGFEDRSRDLLTVSSASLKSFTLLGAWQDTSSDPYEIVIDAPKLTTFLVGEFLRAVVYVNFQSESLEVLELHGLCELSGKCDKLRSLEIHGRWELNELIHLLDFTPTIRELHFMLLDSNDDLSISTLLQPLVNLRSVHFDPQSLHVLQAEGVVQCNLQALEIHLWLATKGGSSSPDTSFLKALFRDHGACKLAIHCGHLINWRSGDIEGIPQEWHTILFELMVFHPGCITFC